MGNLRLTKDEIIDFTIKAALNFFSELLGTGALLFLGCMGSVLGMKEPGDLLGTALCFSFAVIVGIEIGLCNSGGHINPMLTITSMIFKHVSVPMGIIYILGQLCGSLVGFGLVKGLTPSNLVNVGHPEGLCTTMPNEAISIVQAAFVEFIVSSLLVLVVCGQWDPRNKNKAALSLKIGCTVFALAYASALYTGCGMNPARSFGPAVWNNSWKYHWIYWISPMSAAIIWSHIYLKIFMRVIPSKKQEEDKILENE